MPARATHAEVLQYLRVRAGRHERAASTLGHFAAMSFGRGVDTALPLSETSDSVRYPLTSFSFSAGGDTVMSTTSEFSEIFVRNDRTNTPFPDRYSMLGAIPSGSEGTIGGLLLSQVAFVLFDTTGNMLTSTALVTDPFILAGAEPTPSRIRIVASNETRPSAEDTFGFITITSNGVEAILDLGDPPPPDPDSNPIPEPSTLLLFGTGLVVMIVYVWRRERTQQR